MKLDLCIALLFTAHVSAWWSESHMLVAQVAYLNLDSYTREVVHGIISNYDPFCVQSPDFVTSAVWADDLKAEGLSAFSSWHYINKPYSPDNTTGVEPPPNNVLWALGQCNSTLLNDDSGAYSKGFMLRMFVHFVGDVHQPLHATTLFDKMFPTGDAGGNGFRIMVNNESWNLHSFWDSAGTKFASTYDRPLSIEDKSKLFITAEQIMSEYPQSFFNDSDIEQKFAVWVQESYQLGIKYAYLNGSLTFNETVDEQYIQDAQDICTSRIALAGYRLAYNLNRIFEYPRKAPLVTFPIDPYILGGSVVGAFFVGILVPFLTLLFRKRYDCCSGKRDEMEETGLIDRKAGFQRK
eukprot:TRINITY_DN190_c1_g3_i1.p1 TRINITY_DN190_c1_g3~~TRINITY_DN190_c1_g3_i1.p1  ORF type:complete len:351 (-),score=38.77 TRINITY_DN190_c1_g3_i1:138-1190(-)